MQCIFRLIRCIHRFGLFYFSSVWHVHKQRVACHKSLASDFRSNKLSSTTYIFMDCSFEGVFLCMCVIYCKAWHKHEIDSVIGFQRLIVISESIDSSIGSFCTISFVKYCRENNKCVSNNHLNAAFFWFQYTLLLYFLLSLSLSLVLIQTSSLLHGNFDFVFATHSSPNFFSLSPSQSVYQAK